MLKDEIHLLLRIESRLADLDKHHALLALEVRSHMTRTDTRLNMLEPAFARMARTIHATMLPANGHTTTGPASFIQRIAADMWLKIVMFLMAVLIGGMTGPQAFQKFFGQ